MAQIITYINPRGDSIVIGNAAPFLLETIDGVGNVAVNLYSQKSYNQDGETLSEKNLDKRYISVKGIIKHEDIEAQRLNIQRGFNPMAGVGTLIYENKSIKVQAKCIAEHTPTFPSGRQNKGNGWQKFLINLVMHNPFWFDMTEIKEDIATETGNFTFPLHIPPEGLELSIRTISFITNLYNPGDVETPIIIKIKATGTVEMPVITNLNTGEYIRIKRGLEEGDTLEINTEFGNKRVEIIRPDGTRKNVFHYIDYKSKFFSVESGDTQIKYDADVGENNLDVSIYYTPRYVGV